MKESDRVILDNEKKDSALIFLPSSVFELPQQLPPFIPSNKILKVGVEVGWMGFPAVEPDTLCFFSGTISAAISYRDAYLVDGVAISGVSGGPVFQTTGDNKSLADHVIIGMVTAYIPNRATGATLPGLAMAQDVSHFVDTISHLKTLKEARDQKPELQKEIQQELPAPSSDPQPPTQPE